jgi:hypothetical protein
MNRMIRHDSALALIAAVAFAVAWIAGADAFETAQLKAAPGATTSSRPIDAWGSYRVLMPNPLKSQGPGEFAAPNLFKDGQGGAALSKLSAGDKKSEIDRLKHEGIRGEAR